MTIETARLRIVPFDDEHLTARYVGWLNDPDVVRHSELRHRPQTLEGSGVYRESMQRGGHFFWAVVTKDGRHIGNMTAIIDRPNRVADLSIMIGEREVWGQGYGSEAWDAACRYLLEGAEMRKVRAGTMAVNQAMRALMRKSEMEPDGVWRRHLLFEGQEVDVVFAALFAERAA
jgi:RimJ/RimL family protein N-acetyltransferase